MITACVLKVPKALFPRFLSRARTAVAAAAIGLSAAFAFPASAQVLAPGDAVVTGFSGVKPGEAPLAPGANPLDEFFIDLDGPAAQILSLAAPGGAPEGQLIAAPPKLQVRAEQVGQVFAITLDTAGSKTPDIYLGATSAYGLHIVLPDADGDGAPERVKTGHPNAEFMNGQFGPGGGPGSIWRVNGQTGAVTLFATLPGNSGPGVGDIVFDKATRQFFVSDLDSGLIYRLAQNGAVIDSFDHGVAGRPAKGLAPLPDDSSALDIKNPAFDSENPDTWGFTAKDRMVWGLAMHQNRLYYAVAGGQQVWSIGILANGAFAGDARWEFDVNGLPGDGPITDMAFDGQGRLILAQRGAARGSYDYSVFAEPKKSAVVRYSRETPDNPATESAWAPDGDYAIGMPPEHYQAEGGVALGYAHDETGAQLINRCNVMLWSTGHRLRPSADGGTENDVHGLQGNDASLLRPENTPPSQSYFADYDGLFGDAAKSGHMGDVEIWQPCEGVSAPQFGSLPPGFLPPLPNPPGDFPPEFPGGDYETNLRLKKWADPKVCLNWGGGWLCRYRVRVTNTGPDAYFGPILVRDFLPAAPAGALMGFSGPWACWASGGPASHRCWRPGVFLVPGASVELTAYAWVPKSYDKCHLTNAAVIEWAPPGSVWNSDPFDDFDFAVAHIPATRCKPDGGKTDLRILKGAAGDCFPLGGKLRCVYAIGVQNVGVNPYNGVIQFEDTIPAGTTAVFGPGPWACAGPVGNTYTCTHPAIMLAPGDFAPELFMAVDVPFAMAKPLNCEVRNRVNITQAPGGSAQNIDPTNDEANAVSAIPAQYCDDTPKTNLKIEKKANPKLCERHGGGWWCTYQIRVINTGPSEYNGSIEIEEALPAEPLDATWNAPWNCAGMGGGGGGGGGATCTHPNTTIAVDASKILTLKVKFSDAVVKQKGCKLPNVAKIKKAAGGTAMNTNPGDDIAGDTALVPADFCKVEPTNLELQKYGAQTECNIEDGKWRCPYVVIVKNTGPGVYKGEITVKDWLPANAAGATMSVQAPWVCAGAGLSTTCTHPYVELNPAQQVLMQVMVWVPPSSNAGCSLLNTARILEAPGGSVQNQNAGDDQASASLDFPPLLSAGQAFCHTPVGAQPCPPGFKWNGERCDRGQTCAAGTSGVWPNCRKVSEPECPRGTAGNYPNCKRIVDDCPRGFVGTPPNCRKAPEPECPAGTTGKYPNCKQIVRECPRGFVGTPPNCRKEVVEPRRCPPGFAGRFPNCRRIERPCPPGMVGTPPRCRSVKPQGDAGKITRRNEGRFDIRRFRPQEGQKPRGLNQNQNSGVKPNQINR